MPSLYKNDTRRCHLITYSITASYIATVKGKVSMQSTRPTASIAEAYLLSYPYLSAKTGMIAGQDVPQQIKVASIAYSS